MQYFFQKKSKFFVLGYSCALCARYPASAARGRLGARLRMCERVLCAYFCRVCVACLSGCVWVWFLGVIGGRRERGRRAGERERRVSVDGGRIVGGCVRCRLSAYVGGGVECYLFGVDNICGLSGVFYTANGGDFWRTVCVRYITLPQTLIRPSTSAPEFGSFPNHRGEFIGGFSADLVQTTAATTRKARTVGEITEATSFC